MSTSPETLPTGVDPSEPDESQDPSPSEPDPGAVTPRFSEDDLRDAFTSEPEPTDPGPQDPSSDPLDEDDASSVPDPTAGGGTDPAFGSAPPPPDPSTTPDPSDPSTLPPDPTKDPRLDTIEIAGQVYLRTDVEAQLEWAQSLTPEQAARIALALEDPAQSAQSAQSQPAADPSPSAPSSPLDLDDVVDPELAKYVQDQFAAQQVEIEQLREAQQIQAQAEMAQEQARLETAYNATQATLRSELDLSEIEFKALTQQMEQSGVVAFLAQRDGVDDPEALFRTAYEQTFWNIPEFRDRAIQARASETVADATQRVAAQTAARQDRKTRASALSGGGGTPPPRQAPTAPKTSEERFSAFVDGISRSMST